jgi:hypothetical protein
MPVPIKAHTFRPKLCALAIVRYGRRSKVFWLITCCCLLYIVFHGVFCMSVAEPQRDLGAQASPSRTRSPDHEVAAQTLVDDPRMTTPPPATDVRMATPHLLLMLEHKALLVVSERRPLLQSSMWIPSV